MSKVQNFRSISLVVASTVLFLILFSSAASASITETRITNTGTVGWGHGIYGNTIVWNDENYSSGNPTSDIHMYNLSTKKETKITTNGKAWDPSIYGNLIVWVDIRNGNDKSDIYMYDLSTKKEIKITTSGSADGPDIYGNRIVYGDSRSGFGKSDIYMYDLSTKKEVQITTSKLAGNPSIYGNRVVYQDNRNGNSDIYIYDLSTKKEIRITAGGSGCIPDIYGNRIVWEDNRNEYVSGCDIYMYDLSTKKETRITTNSSMSEAPAIYGNSIVWMDDRNGNFNIYAYDLITHQQIHTTANSNQVSPVIYGNKVMWTDYRIQDKPDIYVGTISYLPVAAFTASPVSGKAPLKVSFTDKSTDAYYWSWNFGDKSTSTLPSPVHKYSKAGKYTVSLTVKNAAGSNTVKKTSYITVK